MALIRFGGRSSSSQARFGVSVPERGFVALIVDDDVASPYDPPSFSPRAEIRGFDTGSTAPKYMVYAGQLYSFSPQAGIRGFDSGVDAYLTQALNPGHTVSVPERGFVALIGRYGNRHHGVGLMIAEYVFQSPSGDSWL